MSVFGYYHHDTVQDNATAKNESFPIDLSICKKYGVYV